MGCGAPCAPAPAAVARLAQLYAEVGTPSSVGAVIDRLVEQAQAAGIEVAKRSVIGTHDGELRGHAIGWFHGYPNQISSSGIHVHRRRIAGLQVDGGPAPEEWRRLLRRLTDVYVPSSWCERVLRPVLRPDARVLVVPHGLDEPVPVSTVQARERPTALMLSTGGPMEYHLRKGLDVAVAATRIAGWKLIIRTMGAGAEWIDQQDHAGHVQILREYVTREHLWALARSCSCVLVPSRAEAFGMVPMEALAHGVPVVVAEGTGMDDYLPEDARVVRVPVVPDARELTTYGLGPGLVNEVRPEYVAHGLREVLRGLDERRDAAMAAARPWYVTHSWPVAASPLAAWMLGES